MATAGMVSTICGLYLTSPGGSAGAAQRGLRRRSSRAGWPRCPAARSRSAAGAASCCRTRRFAFACLADELTAVGARTRRLPARLRRRRGPPGRRVDALRIATWERTSSCARAPSSTPAATRSSRTAPAPPPRRRPPSPASSRRSSSCSSTSTRGARRRARAWRCCARWSRPSGTDACRRAPRTSRSARRRSRARSSCKLALDGLGDEISERPRLPDARRSRKAAGASLAAHRVPEDAARRSRARSCPTRRRRSACARAGAWSGATSSRATTSSSGRRFADGVARASWPIELWDDGRLGADVRVARRRRRATTSRCRSLAGARRRQPLRRPAAA